MKNKILLILNKHKNEYISGEVISKELNVSRVAISKHIKKLREEGYNILSQTNKGYCFTEENDILNASMIQDGLDDFFYSIEIVDSIDSTNDELKRKANTLENGYVIIADQQEKGKGRNGRSFHSPKQSGIYMSIFLKPDLSIQHSLKLTACTSVAIFQAIKKNYGLDSQIKWVNDVYLEDKKIAGILCEASLEMNTASLEYMVVGMGINVHSYSKPKELKDIAGSIEDIAHKKVDRNVLIKDILNYFYEYYTTIDENTFLPIYKENSYVLFKNIMVYDKQGSYPARVLDIDENANLVIQKEDKSITTLSSGEISLRLQKV